MLDVAEKLCHKVAIIKEGRIIASGTMEEVKGSGQSGRSISGGGRPMSGNYRILLKTQMMRVCNPALFSPPAGSPEILKDHRHASGSGDSGRLPDVLQRDDRQRLHFSGAGAGDPPGGCEHGVGLCADLYLFEKAMGLCSAARILIR